jgi:spore coat protein U-like protein
VTRSDDGHGGTAQHALANAATGASYVPYDLYLDSARTQVLRNDTAIQIVGDGSTRRIPLYARAFGTPGLTAGGYSDVLTLQLDF